MPPLSFGHFPHEWGETSPHARSRASPAISVVVRLGLARVPDCGLLRFAKGRAPFVLRTFPPRAGETLGFCNGLASGGNLIRWCFYCCYVAIVFRGWVGGDLGCSAGVGYVGGYWV